MTGKTWFVAAFTGRPVCRACGYDRFRWEYRRFAGPEAARTIGDAEHPHLHLDCERCGWGFDMATREEGA